MRRLFTFEYGGHNFSLEGTDWGVEVLLVDDKEISRKHNFKNSGSHTFSLDDLDELTLQFKIHIIKPMVNFRLLQGEEVLVDDESVLEVPKWIAKLEDKAQGETKDIEATGRSPAKKSGHFVSLIGIFFKLFKSAKAVKVALAGASFASWSYLFDWKFALVLISVIVFHEYGHVNAMKRYGIPTKGIYLIPFFGGLAVGDRAKTQWQELYISMMGPVYGLVMSIVFWGLYTLTNNPIAALVATFSALINLFNLLPVFPLDGGRVMKAMVFSGKKTWRVVVLLAISVVAFLYVNSIGLFFISFFIFIGILDLFFSWKEFDKQEKPPMSISTIFSSLAWYLAVVGVFILIILSVEGTNIPGTEIPRIILSN